MENLAQKKILHDSSYTYLANNYYKLDTHDNALIYTNEEVLNIQRSMPSEMMKQILQVMVGSRSINSLSPPIKVYTFSSLIYFYIIEFTYLNFFIKKALDEKDPLKRIKWIISYTIASKHLLLTNEKPLDPVLGETTQFQADDLKIYTECISVSPIVVIFYGVGTNYKVNGYFEPRDTTTPISNVTQKGMKLNILLNDKIRTHYLISSPELQVNNLLTGKRNLNYIGTQEIVDKKNKLYCKTFYNAESKKSIFDKIFTNKKDRFDFFKGIVTQNKMLFESDSNEVFKSNDVISYYEGNWVDFIMIDGEKLWKFNLYEPPELILQNQLIPSDNSLRNDYKFLKEKNMELAQTWHNIIEEQAMEDKKKRDKFKSS